MCHTYYGNDGACRAVVLKDKMKTLKKVGLAGLSFGLLSSYASASDPASIIAGVICSLVPDVLQLAQVVAIVMFIYGGAKYAYGADDPGGRKQGKNIAVHAIIGLLIVGISKNLVMAISGVTSLC